MPRKENATPPSGASPEQAPDRTQDTASAPNPFDPAAFRGDQSRALVTRKVRTVVPVRKPKRNEWFRVSPDPDYTLDAFLYPHETDQGEEVYLVHPDVVAEFDFELRLNRLFTVVTRQGAVLVWPQKLPSEDSDLGRTWYESGLEVASVAMSRWVRMVADRALNAYGYTVVSVNLGDPAWPDESFAKLLEMAFRGKVIDNPDHPILRELRGEV